MSHRTMSITLVSGKKTNVRISCDFAYVLQSDNPDGIVKVGRSELPKQRFNSIRTNVPFRLTEIAILGDGQRRETEMKRLLAPFHVKGEWYKPSQELNDYLTDAYRTGSVLVCRPLDELFVEEHIRPVVLEHLGERRPSYNKSGNFIYRFLHEGYPAVQGQLLQFMEACAPSIPPELVHGFVSAPIAGHAPRVRLASDPVSAPEQERIAS